MLSCQPVYNIAKNFEESVQPIVFTPLDKSNAIGYDTLRLILLLIEFSLLKPKNPK